MADADANNENETGPGPHTPPPSGRRTACENQMQKHREYKRKNRQSYLDYDPYADQGSVLPRQRLTYDEPAAANPQVVSATEQAAADVAEQGAAAVEVPPSPNNVAAAAES
eukprot:TRINITY_DN14091_c0_g1_i2.p2 TRINITY_DN14091_c0_g1~~TRINITY_DN14091_c0_g1_i2.p2  ORF type:complete len:111 (-),score=10.39 TRINITY_DN14091_c0_g1_i2:218-550(-)